jgi:hypothetical protein
MQDEEPFDLPDDVDGDPQPEDYFIGVASPRALFTMHIEGLDELMSRKPEWSTVIRIESEVCVIALVSYFEAFCKDVFAGAVNICPDLLLSFREAGQGTTIDAADLLQHRNTPLARIGGLLGEQIDFGSARKINAIYRALVKVSPFSSGEIIRYDQLLNDRNLLVHHGGVYTSRYLAQLKERTPPAMPRKNVLEITPAYFATARHLLEGIADKLAQSVRDRIGKFVESAGIEFSETQWEAVWLLAWNYTYR